MSNPLDAIDVDRVGSLIRAVETLTLAEAAAVRTAAYARINALLAAGPNRDERTPIERAIDEAAGCKR